ncbi:MAG: hypothetical protein FWD22_06025 [Treponema sp.]|nr:hypothetical protein [Treponema sp.]
MKHLSVLFIALAAALVMTLGGCVTSGYRAAEEIFSVELESRNIEIGEVELQMETLLGLGRLKKERLTVLYYPNEDAVCIQYRKDFINFHQFWSSEGREDFINALEIYNEDYNARDLNRNDRKSKQKYGKTRGYLIWQQATFLVRARAGMDVELGYTFKERAPYFTIHQLEAEYIDEMARDNDRTSQATVFYFTRAQAAELAALFDHEFLKEFAPDSNTSPVDRSNIPRDEY